MLTVYLLHSLFHVALQQLMGEILFSLEFYRWGNQGTQITKLPKVTRHMRSKVRNQAAQIHLLHTTLSSLSPASFHGPRVFAHKSDLNVLMIISPDKVSIFQFFDQIKLNLTVEYNCFHSINLKEVLHRYLGVSKDFSVKGHKSNYFRLWGSYGLSQPLNFPTAA